MIGIIKHNVTGEIITPENMNRLIEIYGNQKNSEWIEIPSNHHKGHCSPFHVLLQTNIDNLIICLKKAEEIINLVFDCNNSSAIVLKPSRKNDSYRIIYPEITVSMDIEKKLINTFKSFNIPATTDNDTQLPLSGKYKCIGLFSGENIEEEDVLHLAHLNGATFSQTLGQFNILVNKVGTKVKCN